MNSILFFVLVLSIRWRKVKTATLTLTFYSGGGKIQRTKLREKFGEGEYLFSGGEENREGKGGKYLENIFSKIVKEIKKSRFRSRDFCQVLEGFVSVSENLVPEKKILVLVLENLVSEKSMGSGQNFVSEKSLCIGFGKYFGIVNQ